MDVVIYSSWLLVTSKTHCKQRECEYKMAQPAKISNVKEHLAEGKITEDGLAASRKLGGQPLRIGRNLHNELICKETIKRAVAFRK